LQYLFSVVAETMITMLLLLVVVVMKIVRD